MTFNTWYFRDINFIQITYSINRNTQSSDNKVLVDFFETVCPLHVLVMIKNNLKSILSKYSLANALALPFL